MTQYARACRRRADPVRAARPMSVPHGRRVRGYSCDQPSRAETVPVEQGHAFGSRPGSCTRGNGLNPNTGARAGPDLPDDSYVFEDPESAAAYFKRQA